MTHALNQQPGHPPNTLDAVRDYKTLKFYLLSQNHPQHAVESFIDFATKLNLRIPTNVCLHYKKKHAHVLTRIDNFRRIGIINSVQSEEGEATIFWTLTDNSLLEKLIELKK
jgi:hypothetical protein